MAKPTHLDPRTGAGYVHDGNAYALVTNTIGAWSHADPNRVQLHLWPDFLTADVRPHTELCDFCRERS